jgi:CRP-like cAMP-binding protein
MNCLGLLALTHERALPRRWDQPTPGDWANVLATFPLFAGVSKRRLRNLACKATLAGFSPGEPINLTGDPAEVLYIILSGQAKTMSGGSGRVLRACDYFGELAPIPGRPPSKAVVAVSYVYAMTLPSRSVLQLARRHPAITLTMLSDLTTQLRQLEAEGAHAA